MVLQRLGRIFEQRNSHVPAILVRHAEARNIVFHKGLLAAEFFSTNNHKEHNMNITPKIETVALREIVPFSLRVCFLAFLLSAVSVCFAQPPSPTPDTQTQFQTSATELAEAEPAPTIPPEELEALVAPIALYPDPLLIQVLAASTYPLEIVQLKQWMDENKKLKGKGLAEAVVQRNWDPSVQGLAAFPGVVEKLANNIQWTTDLGNAFLAQEADVMDAVQGLRAKAQENGALKANDKQTVSTETMDDGTRAITIEPAQRDVVYVPTYKTEVVYRDSSSSGYSGSSGSSSYSDGDYSYAAYSVAAAYGAAYAYWGNYNWRDRSAEVNYNNYHNNRYNQNWNNKVNNSNNNVNNWSNKVSNWNGSQGDKFSQRATQGIGKWQHDPSHRGNVPYANRSLANGFGQANNRPFGRAGNQSSQLSAASARNQLVRANLSRPSGGARPSTTALKPGAPDRVGSRMPLNGPGTRGGAFSPPKGDIARAASVRGGQSMRPPDGFRGGPPSDFRGGPPAGLRAGGPPDGGFRGGPPMGGGFRGAPPMGGGFPRGMPMGGGPPMGGAPPPPPPPAP
jgi:Protein of unknown function (DUF3300)